VQWTYSLHFRKFNHHLQRIQHGTDRFWSECRLHVVTGHWTELDHWSCSDSQPNKHDDIHRDRYQHRLRDHRYIHRDRLRQISSDRGHSHP